MKSQLPLQRHTQSKKGNPKLKYTLNNEIITPGGGMFHNTGRSIKSNQRHASEAGHKIFGDVRCSVWNRRKSQ